MEEENELKCLENEKEELLKLIEEKRKMKAQGVEPKEKLAAEDKREELCKKVETLQTENEALRKMLKEQKILNAQKEIAELRKFLDEESCEKEAKAPNPIPEKRVSSFKLEIQELIQGSSRGESRPQRGKPYYSSALKWPALPNRDEASKIRAATDAWKDQARMFRRKYGSCIKEVRELIETRRMILNQANKLSLTRAEKSRIHSDMDLFADDEE
uniref:Uncharacterized protein n=1 Tax=Lutzomyia longipalpis TaxID=7200 RepID=A0A1B0CHH9_LUTLO